MEADGILHRMWVCQLISSGAPKSIGSQVKGFQSLPLFVRTVAVPDPVVEGPPSATKRVDAFKAIDVKNFGGADAAF